MSESKYLSALINVFSIVPTFLLPVFSDGREFFFQVLEGNTIDHFELADLSHFVESPSYQIFDRTPYQAKSPALYAIDMPGGKYVYGNSASIADAYYSNHLDFVGHPDFIGSMERFLNQTGRHAQKARKPIDAKLVPAKQGSLGIVFDQHLFAAETTISKRKMAHYIKEFTHYLEIAKSFRIPLSDIDVIRNFAALSEIVSLEDIFKIDSSKSKIFEDSQHAVCSPIKLLPEADDIFAFRRFYKDPYLKSTIKYRKSSYELPVKRQIEMLDTLLLDASSGRDGRRTDCGVQFTLWNDDLVEQLFTKNSPSQFLHISCKDQLRTWGIDINRPKLNDTNAVALPESFWESQLPDIEGEAEMEDAQLFWLEIKALSKEIFLIIAQTYFTHKNYFFLKEKNLSSANLIDFITALYYNFQNRKVMLLRLRSADFTPLFDDNLNVWLAENEDKCVIRDVHYEIRG